MNEQLGYDLWSDKRLRQAYSRLGIKRKKVLLSKQKPKDYNIQKPAHLKTLDNLYENTISNHSDNIVYLDEVTFSAKTLQNRAWAELNENVR